MAREQLGPPPSGANDAVTKDYVDTAAAAGTKYAATIGNGSLTSIPVTHNLGTTDVLVSVHLISSGEEVDCDVFKTSDNVITLNFATAPASNSLRCVIVGTGANGVFSSTGVTTSANITSVGRSVITAADAAAARSAIGAATKEYFVNIKDYGAVGDGTTDDTEAIEAAHAAILANSGKGTLFFPAGNYVYNGTGLTFSPNRPPRIVGVGSGLGSNPLSHGTQITLGSNSYLLNISGYLWALLLRDIRVTGGKGTLRHTYNQVNVSNNKFIIQNCHFENYTECAIATDAYDMPYWVIENCAFRAANTTGTIGIALNRCPNQSVIQNCSFTINRVHLKVRNGNDLQILNCDFMQSLYNSGDNSGGPRVTGIWVVPAPTDEATGENLFVRGSKFGNEHESAGDYKILIANEGDGTTNGNKMPNFDANSTGFVTGLDICHNSISSNSDNANSSFIYSTTPNVRGLQVCHNVINGGKSKYVLEFRDPSLVVPSAQCRSVFGPFTATVMGSSSDVSLQPSNAPGVAEWIDPLMVHQWPTTIRHNGGGSSASYRQLLTSSITAALQTGGGTKTPISDAFGGTDAIKLKLGTSTVTSAYLALPAFTIGMPVWVEVDVANPNDGNAVDWFRLYVRDSNAAFHFSRTVKTPDVSQGWVTYAWSFTPRTVGNAPTFIQFGAPDALSSEKTVNIGRVRVYHGNERQIGGSRPTTTAATTTTAAANLTNDLRNKLIGLGIVSGTPYSGSVADSKSGDIIYAADTITADGTTDVSTALGTLISTAPSGSVIQLAAGTYYAPTMKVSVANSVTILGVPGKTVILGSGTKTSTTSYYTDYLFNVTAGSIFIRDVKFSGTWTPIRISNLRNLDDITLDSCQFINCTGVVQTYINATADDAQIALGVTQTFRDFSMRDCKVQSCELGVRLTTFGGWRSVHIHDNVFQDVGHVAVYTGYSYRDTFMTYTTAQAQQCGVKVHDNTFRNIRESTYILSAVAGKAGANAIVCMGKNVLIHDNYVENVGVADMSHDSEGIYTKAQYANIHSNVLLNAGGNEASIMVKGSDDYDAKTSIASDSNGQSIGSATINVESTEAFQDGTTAGYRDYIRIQATVGGETVYRQVYYTSKNETQFLGCYPFNVATWSASREWALNALCSNGGQYYKCTTAGTSASSGGPTGTGSSITDGTAVWAWYDLGVMFTGGEVKIGSSGSVSTDPQGSPSIVRGNIVSFSDDYAAAHPTIQLKGIGTACRRVHMIDNMIIGATGRAFVVLDGGTVERNLIYDHHGALVIFVGGSGVTVRDNRIYNFDGSFRSYTSYSVISVEAKSYETLRDVRIVGNQLRNQLNASNALTTVQTKTRMVNVVASGGIDDIEIRNNSARNLRWGIGSSVAGIGTITNLMDIDNTWVCETGAAVDNVLTAVTSKSQRFLPGTGSVGLTLQTITGAATIPTSTDQIVLIDTGGLPTLATAVGCKSRITLKNRTSAGVAIGTTNNQTIEGVTGFTLPPGQAVDLVADSTNNWSVI
jgi:hypothetical protein